MKLSGYLSIIAMALFISMNTLAQKNDTEKTHLPRYYVAHAKESIQGEKWSAAKPYLDEGLKHYPDDPDLNWLMGRYHHHNSDLRNARHYLIRAIQNDGSHVDAKRMMITVEEESQNYSSAIGYCNELLEVIPYEKTLWNRKIELYRKMGNTELADNLLRRLAKVYPDDSLIRRNVDYQYELDYQSKMKEGKLKEASDNLQSLIDNNPRRLQYYIDLINVYKRRGMYDSAIATATAGIAQLGNNQQLVTQKVNLLCAAGRTQEALNFIGELKKKGGGAYLATLQKNVMAEAAQAARLSDPYEMTAKMYDMGIGSDNLDYLLTFLSHAAIMTMPTSIFRKPCARTATAPSYSTSNTN